MIKALSLSLLVLSVAGCSPRGFVRSGWHVGSITLCYVHSDTRVASAVSESACISIEPDSPSDDRPGTGLLLGRTDEVRGARSHGDGSEHLAQSDRSLACRAE